MLRAYPLWGVFIRPSQLIRLSSRVDKYGAGGRILFYNFYFPQEETMTILFLSTKGVSDLMLLTCVLDISNWK
jgi:hypothetical protein